MKKEHYPFDDRRFLWEVVSCLHINLCVIKLYINLQILAKFRQVEGIVGNIDATHDD